jgi:hypothetical protein
MKCIRQRNKRKDQLHIILAEPIPAAAQTTNNQNEKQLETQVNEMASSVLYDRNKKTKKGSILFIFRTASDV